MSPVGEFVQEATALCLQNQPPYLLDRAFLIDVTEELKLACKTGASATPQDDIASIEAAADLANLVLDAIEDERRLNRKGNPEAARRARADLFVVSEFRDACRNLILHLLRTQT